MTDKIEEQGHKRGCEGRNYACTCGYDDRVEAELSRLRSSNEAMRKALILIAHTFTEDSHGGTKSLSASEYQDMARAALSLQEEEAR